MKARYLTALLVAGVCALALSATAQDDQPKRVRVGGEVMKAKLIQQVEPVYPPLAERARIQGTVRLQAVVSPEGSVQELTVLSGHPLLVQSALDTVRRWRYEPTLLNGAPITVVTTVDVRFTLEGGAGGPTESPEISPSFETGVRRLIELSGARAFRAELAETTMKSLRTELLRGVPPGERHQQIVNRLSEKIDAAFNLDEYVKSVVGHFASRFTQEEVTDLIRFFETPVGQRLIEVMPLLTPMANMEAQMQLQRELSRIVRELKEEFPELKKP